MPRLYHWIARKLLSASPKSSRKRLDGDFVVASQVIPHSANTSDQEGTAIGNSAAVLAVYKEDEQIKAGSLYFFGCPVTDDDRED
ncbi:hypothetical protein ACP4OV_015046 [Aristida adscensionis]